MSRDKDQNSRKKNVLTSFLWALVLLLCFPAFFTVLAVKRKTSLYPRLKWVIIAGLWALYAFVIYWGIVNDWHW